MVFNTVKSKNKIIKNYIDLMYTNNIIFCTCIKQQSENVCFKLNNATQFRKKVKLNYGFKIFIWYFFNIKKYKIENHYKIWHNFQLWQSFIQNLKSNFFTSNKILILKTSHFCMQIKMDTTHVKLHVNNY